MVVNGSQLPVSFVKLCQESREGKTEDTWLLKGRMDAYGNRLSNSDVDFLATPEKIKKETDYLGWAFREDDRFHADPADAHRPGFVEATSVEEFIWYGTVGSGEPFCFDFRQYLQEPRVITWNDAYWQRVAPDFDTFLGLFAPGTEEQWEAWSNRSL